MTPLLALWFIGISIHQQAVERMIEEPALVAPAPTTAPPRVPLVKTGVVYGYLNYWYTPDQVQRWDLLTHLVYFGTYINTSGVVSQLNGVGGANYVALREKAHANGVKFLIAAMNFDSSSDPTSVSRLLAHHTSAVKNLTALAVDHGADGISLDFEIVPQSDKQNYVDFLAELSASIKAAIPGGHVSSAVMPPTGWPGYDYAGIVANSDLTFVMAYEYYGSSSTIAGPLTPTTDGTHWGSANLTTTCAKLATATGDARDKMVIGLPWYGYDFPTSNGAVPDARIAAPTAYTYAKGASAIQSPSERHADVASLQPYAVSTDSNHVVHQLWLDDAASFALKMDVLQTHGFGGVGIFTIGYEGTEPRFWTEIEKRYAHANQTPRAVIDAPVSGIVGVPMALSAQRSTDAEADPLAYAWTSNDGTFSDATAASPTFVPSHDGDATVSLTVSDPYASSAPVQAPITITAAVVAPVVTPIEPPPPITQQPTAVSTHAPRAHGCRSLASPLQLVLLLLAIVACRHRRTVRGRAGGVAE